MFYTRSNGVRVRATMVGFAPDGLLHLEYFQDAVKVVNRQCKVQSISFAIPSADSPPPCSRSPSPPPDDRGRSPSKSATPPPRAKPRAPKTKQRSREAGKQLAATMQTLKGGLSSVNSEDWKEGCPKGNIGPRTWRAGRSLTVRYPRSRRGCARQKPKSCRKMLKKKSKASNSQQKQSSIADPFPLKSPFSGSSSSSSSSFSIPQPSAPASPCPLVPFEKGNGHHLRQEKPPPRSVQKRMPELRTNCSNFCTKCTTRWSTLCLLSNATLIIGLKCVAPQFCASKLHSWGVMPSRRKSGTRIMGMTPI